MNFNSHVDIDKNSIPKVVTLGMFDGVHLGHKQLIKLLQQNQDDVGQQSLLITFDVHPKIVIDENSNLKLLTTIDEKINLLKSTGVDEILVLSFNYELSQLSAKDFIEDVLIKKLNMITFIIGHDHHFGKNREGNFNLLQALSKKHKFKLIQVNEYKKDSIVVSSSAIREHLSMGNIKAANKFLGYHYFITGQVVEGNKIGRKLGFPTANIEVDKYKFLPKKGAYIVRVLIDNLSFYGMMNIGHRPTINGVKEVVEVHIFDFEDNIYNKTIQVEFLDFLRDEIKFDSLEQLKTQLIYDKEKATIYIKG